MSSVVNCSWASCNSPRRPARLSTEAPVSCSWLTRSSWRRFILVGQFHRPFLTGDEGFDGRRDLLLGFLHLPIETVQLPADQAEADEDRGGGHQEADEDHPVHGIHHRLSCGAFGSSSWDPGLAPPPDSGSVYGRGAGASLDREATDGVQVAAVGEGRDLDHFAGVWRVDVLSLADVDAHMVHGAAEREKIPRP